MRIFECKNNIAFIHEWAGLPPVFRKVSAWVWARRAFYSQATWRCVSDAARIMTTASAFEWHQVSPNSEDSVNLLVPILDSNFMSLREMRGRKKDLQPCQKDSCYPFCAIVGDRNHRGYLSLAVCVHEMSWDSRTWRRCSVSRMSLETSPAVVIEFFGRWYCCLGSRGNLYARHGHPRYRRPWIQEAQQMDMGRRIPRVQVVHGDRGFWEKPCRKSGQSSAIIWSCLSILDSTDKKTHFYSVQRGLPVRLNKTGLTTKTSSAQAIFASKNTRLNVACVTIAFPSIVSESVMA